MREIDPAQTRRAAAFQLWMSAPMPMVTLFKTLDVTPLVRWSKKYHCKFNMMMCWCIGKAASQVEEFFLLPVGDKLIGYDRLAVNTVVAAKDGEISTCDVPFSPDLAQFERDYLRLTAQVEEGEDPGPILDPVVEEIRREAGEWLYGINVGNLQTALVHTLLAKELTIATAESCTGGLVAQRITSVPGASGAFEWGAVTYSCETKRRVLGVSQRMLDTYGAVSVQTAMVMARGARRKSGADIAVSGTGNAGPEPREGKPVGLVVIGVDSDAMTTVQEVHIPPTGNRGREYIREIAASQALYLALQAAKLTVSRENPHQ